MHIISLDEEIKDTIKIVNENYILQGRGNDSDVKISDISVSRLHALLKIKEDKIYIEDHQSKFGTLILLQN